MIEALLIALIYIAIVCLLAWGILAVIQFFVTQAGGSMPQFVITIVWVIVGVICLLILLRAITGAGGIGLEFEEGSLMHGNVYALLR